jgi:lysozyme
VLRYLNQGQPIAAALAMHAWRRARVNGRVLVIDALVRRRAAEAALFLEPLGPRPAAPSSVLSPEIDYTAALLSHASDPRDVAFGVGADGATIATDPSPSWLPEPSKAETPEPVKVLTEAIQSPELKADAPLEEPNAVIAAELQTEQSNEAPVAVVADPVLVPFPNEDGIAANQLDQSQRVPANDGLRTLAPWASGLEPASEAMAPGGVEIARPPVLEPAASTRALTWAMLVVGAVFLAGGLWFAHLMGALTPEPEGKPISLQGIIAILSAAFGFVAVGTSAVFLARGPEGGDETALLP